MKNKISIQEKTPFILSQIFILVIIILAKNKLMGWDESRQFYGFLLIFFYIIWLLLETIVSAGEMKRSRTSYDRGTCEFYALGRAVVVIAALALPIRWKETGLWVPIGICCFLFGVILRLWAIWVLGHYYSHRVRIPEHDKIITTGPYRIIRHPAYSGMLISHMGFVCFFFNWASLGLLIGVFLPAVLVRINIEENTLFTLQGYRDFFKRKKRLIPFVW